MKRSIIIIALLLSSLAVSAQSQSALPWMRIGRGAGMQGMADAAVVSDLSAAWSSFSNPAVVPFTVSGLSASLSYDLWQADKTNYINAGVAYNILDRFGVTVGFSYGLGKSYDQYDQYGIANGSYVPSNFQVNLGGAWRFVDFMSLGLNIRYAGQKLTPEVSNTTFAGDAMLMGGFSDFRVLIGVANLGTAIADNAGNKFKLSSSLKFGAGYEKYFSLKHGMGAYLDADYYFYGGFGAALGAQYAFSEMLFARAGYRFGVKSVIPSYASIGLGFKMSGFSVDVAYLFASESVANSLCLGLGYAF